MTRRSSVSSTVGSFHTAIGSKKQYLDGTLENVSIAGDFASGDWVWSGGNGQQAVMLSKSGSTWLIAENSNDFPTAVLHFFD